MRVRLIVAVMIGAVALGLASFGVEQRAVRMHGKFDTRFEPAAPLDHAKRSEGLGSVRTFRPVEIEGRRCDERACRQERRDGSASSD
jgi:hypothetical protein